MKKLFQFDAALMVILIFSAFFISNQQIVAQNETTAFKRISSEQGLSNDAVTDIIEDRKGFMWFATMDGMDLCGRILCPINIITLTIAFYQK